MIIITDYQLIDKEESMVCISREAEAKCPICGSLLCPHDSRKRRLKKYGGVCTYIRIRRLKCLECGKLHNELPDILVPYKHYAAEVIENVVDEIVTSDDLITEDCPCEETMRRWRRWIRRNISYINEYLDKAAKGRYSRIYLKFLSYIKDGSFSRLEDIRKCGAGWLSATMGILYCSGGRMLLS